jgi:hypothetical protein
MATINHLSYDLIWYFQISHFQIWFEIDKFLWHGDFSCPVPHRGIGHGTWDKYFSVTKKNGKIFFWLFFCGMEIPHAPCLSDAWGVGHGKGKK